MYTFLRSIEFLKKRELRDIIKDTLIDNGKSQANPRLKNATCIIFKIKTSWG